MSDSGIPPVAQLSEEWIAAHRAALVEEIRRSEPKGPAPDHGATSNPRRRGRVPRRGLAAGGLGVCALAGVAVGLLLAFSGARPQSAFAGWSPVPAQVPSAQTAELAAACGRDAVESWLRSFGPGAREREVTEEGKPVRETTRQREWQPPKVEADEWQAMLTDTRGPWISVVLEADEGRAVHSCLFGPPASQATRSFLESHGVPSYAGPYEQRANGGYSRQPPSPVAAGQISNGSRWGEVPQSRGRTLGPGATARMMPSSSGRRGGTGMLGAARFRRSDRVSSD